MKKTVTLFKGMTEVDNVKEADYMYVKHEGTKEELAKIFPELFDKPTWVDGVLGCIGFDGHGHRVYEDVVHDIGKGKFRYYIDGIGDIDARGDIWYTIPERDDIPKEYWGIKSLDRWIEFSK